MSNDPRKPPRSTQEDPFLGEFFSELPDDLQTDFSNRQLAALKSIFGDATRRGHDYDIRFSLATPLIGPGIYMAVMGGRDQRKKITRRTARSGWRRWLGTFFRIIFRAIAIMVILLAVIAVILLSFIEPSQIDDQAVFSAISKLTHIRLISSRETASLVRPH